MSSSAGKDTNSGLSTSLSFKTLTKAVGVASPGDTIEIMAGTYNEQVIIRRQGSSSGWITLKNYSNDKVILKSSGVGPTVYFYHGNCDETVIGTGSGNTHAGSSEPCHCHSEHGCTHQRC